MTLNCRYCGCPTVRAILDGETVICPNCYSVLGSCGACVYGSGCMLEHYHGSTPVMINKTIHIDNMVMQVQVPNPALIDEVCKPNCKCYGEYQEDGVTIPICWHRNASTCSNYKEIN